MGEWETRYEVGIDRHGVQPLVLVREFSGVVPAIYEIEQEFRLFHDLFARPGTTGLWKLLEDGTLIQVVKTSDDEVAIATKYLRQYMAARQLSLALYIDAAAFGSADDDVLDTTVWKSDSENIELAYGGPPGRVLSRYLGTRLIDAPPIEKSGVWPFEAERSYAEFVIGVDEDGDDIKYTSDPDQLANYFGKNPDSPHYLTPVHFQRSVLQKYYDAPELYAVSDGRLACASLWAIQIDNSAPESVIVFLGDLGRDLPESEQGYWQSFNIAPVGPLSETSIRRSFFAQFADPSAVDLQVRQRYVPIPVT